MAEYVDKQKARDLFQQKCYNVSDRINSVELGMFVEGIMQVLDEATAADVQPVKRGEWKYYKNNGIYDTYKCSICKESFELSMDADISQEIRYCPNCGARMKEDK